MALSLAVLKNPYPAVADSVALPTAAMIAVIRFGDYMSSKAFLPRLNAQSPREAIMELAAVAADVAELDANTIAARTWSGEMLVGSTMGNGVATPYARIEGLKEPLVAIGLSPQGTDFDSPDGIPTRVVVLLLTARNDSHSHISLFRSISQAFAQPRVAEKMIARVANYTELRAFLNIEFAHAARRRA